MAEPRAKTISELERELRQAQRNLAAARAAIGELQAAWKVSVHYTPDVPPETQALTERLHAEPVLMQVSH